MKQQLDQQPNNNNGERPGPQSKLHYRDVQHTPVIADVPPNLNLTSDYFTRVLYVGDEPFAEMQVLGLKDIPNDVYAPFLILDLKGEQDPDTVLAAIAQWKRKIDSFEVPVQMVFKLPEEIERCPETLPSLWREFSIAVIRNDLFCSRNIHAIHFIGNEGGRNPFHLFSMTSSLFSLPEFTHGSPEKFWKYYTDELEKHNKKQELLEV